MRPPRFSEFPYCFSLVKLIEKKILTYSREITFYCVMFLIYIYLTNGIGMSRCTR